MSSHLRKLDVDQLRPGMYVEALDRSWLETDFELQGLRISDGADIERLQRFCRHVYITNSESNAAEAEAGSGGNAVETGSREPIAFSQELGNARVVHGGAKLLVDDMHDDIRDGQPVDMGGVHRLVDQIMASVFRHPDALVWFTNLKNRDEYTALHSMNVCMLAVAFASFIDEPEASVRQIGIGSLLHDVGKIKIPLEVLNKPGRLTDDEFALIKKHPELGVEILRESHDLTRDSLEIVWAHHERINGRGYPRGLAGNEMTRFARIVAIVDVYDAMTSDRVYHNGRTPAEVLGIMAAADGDFDPELIQQFAEYVGNYPAGSLVELNTGEVGLVMPGAARDEKPVVLIILDHNKKRYFPQRIRDLKQFPKFNVKSVLPAGQYGVDVRDYAEALE